MSTAKQIIDNAAETLQSCSAEIARLRIELAAARAALKGACDADEASRSRLSTAVGLLDSFDAFNTCGVDSEHCNWSAEYAPCWNHRRRAFLSDPTLPREPVPVPPRVTYSVGFCKCGAIPSLIGHGDTVKATCDFCGADVPVHSSPGPEPTKEGT